MLGIGQVLVCGPLEATVGCLHNIKPDTLARARMSWYMRARMHTRARTRALTHTRTHTHTHAYSRSMSTDTLLPRFMPPQMGMAMGQDPEILHEVCGWINAAATRPVWAKLSPNVTDITVPARSALDAGCEGVAAINTIQVRGLAHACLCAHACGLKQRPSQTCGWCVRLLFRVRASPRAYMRAGQAGRGGDTRWARASCTGTLGCSSTGTLGCSSTGTLGCSSTGTLGCGRGSQRPGGRLRQGACLVRSAVFVVCGCACACNICLCASVCTVCIARARSLSWA